MDQIKAHVLDTYSDFSYIPVLNIRSIKFRVTFKDSSGVTKNREVLISPYVKLKEVDFLIRKFEDKLNSYSINLESLRVVNVFLDFETNYININ